MRSRHPWSDERERRSVEDARPRSGCRDRGDPPRLPAAGEGEPPRRRGRVGAAAVPRDPGRVRAARRPERASPGRRPPGAIDPDAARALASGPGPGKRLGPRRRPASGRPSDRATRRRGRARRDREREPAAGEPGRRPERPARPADVGRRSRRRGGRRRIDPVAPAVGKASLAEQGDAVLDLLRPGRRGALRAGLERGQLVRLVERHLLDDQPEGVRRPAQARPGVPAPGAARGERLDRGRRGARRPRLDPEPGRQRRACRRAAPARGDLDRRGGGGSAGGSRGARRMRGSAAGRRTPRPAPRRRRWGTFHRPRPPAARTRATGSRSRRRIAGSADRSSAGRRPASAGSRWRSWPGRRSRS